MRLIPSVSFRLMYRLGFTPWDSGVPPPELIEVIEGARRLPAGRALDIGCGTGTTTVYMASKGWQVTGVDFVPRAIRAAGAKAAAARLPVAFLVGDVTRPRVPDRSGLRPSLRPGMLPLPAGDGPARVCPRGNPDGPIWGNLLAIRVRAAGRRAAAPVFSEGRHAR